MVTAHWEKRRSPWEPTPPPMIYDYGVFPPETYEVVYPAPGEPQVAARAAEADPAVRNYHEDSMFGRITSSGYRLHADPPTPPTTSTTRSST
ncbi:MAG: hypothetical protein R2710_29945 [Acidimicrobiales bacterium]